MYFFSIIFSYPFYYLRTFYFPFSLRSRNFYPTSLSKQALLPPLHNRTRLLFCCEKTLALSSLVDLVRIAHHTHAWYIPCSIAAVRSLSDLPEGLSLYTIRLSVLTLKNEKPRGLLYNFQVYKKTAWQQYKPTL